MKHRLEGGGNIACQLGGGMKWFLGVYTARFNRQHKLFGHLFSGRYKSLIVDGSGNGDLKTVCDYVHLNPVRAQLIGENQRLENYPWSSYPHLLQKRSGRPEWLRAERLFGEWMVPVDSTAGRRMFAAQMEARRTGERDQEYKVLRRGWFLGDKTFRKELLAQMAGWRGSGTMGRNYRRAPKNKRR